MTAVKTIKTTIPCSRCNGKGHVELDGELNTTLLLLRKWGEASATQLYLVLVADNPITVTAVNNRLEDLRQLGLVSRRRNGRQWIYTPTKPKK